MRRALVALVALLPSLAWAEPPAQAQPDAPLVALSKGDPAPYSGLLLTEDRLRLYLAQQTEVERCSLKLKLRDDALTAALADTRAAGDKAERSWLEKNGLWLGLAVGVVAGVAGTVYLVEAARK